MSRGPVVRTGRRSRGYRWSRLAGVEAVEDFGSRRERSAARRWEVSTVIGAKSRTASVEGSRSLPGCSSSPPGPSKNHAASCPRALNGGLQRTQDRERVALRAVQEIVLRAHRGFITGRGRSRAAVRRCFARRPDSASSRSNACACRQHMTRRLARRHTAPAVEEREPQHIVLEERREVHERHQPHLRGLAAVEPVARLELGVAQRLEMLVDQRRVVQVNERSGERFVGPSKRSDSCTRTSVQRARPR